MTQITNTTSTLVSRVRPAAWLTDALLIAVAMVWASSFAVSKTALAFLPVLWFLAMRFAMTALILTPFLLKSQQSATGSSIAPASTLSTLSTQGKTGWRIGLIMGGMLLVIFLLETFGVYGTQASKATFLISLFVVFTPLVEWMLLGNRPSRAVVTVALVSCVGVAMMTGANIGGMTTSINVGDGLIIAAGLMRAIATVINKKLLANSNISMLNLTAIQSWVVAVGCALLAILTDTPFALPTAMIFWLGLGYLVVFCTLFAFMAQNFAVKHSSASRVSILLGTEPIFGAAFAVIWLQEQLSLQAWLGGFIIVLGCLYLTVFSGKTDNR